jgi:transcriptional regulator with XRE-family HTH domain
MAPFTREFAHLEEEDAIFRARARLRAWLKIRRMTLREVATATGIPYRTVQSYVAGDTAIPMGALRRICLVSGASADWILFGQPIVDLVALGTSMDALAQMRALGLEVSHEQGAAILMKQYMREFLDQFGAARLLGSPLFPDEDATTSQTPGPAGRSTAAESGLLHAPAQPDDDARPAGSPATKGVKRARSVGRNKRASKK